MSTQQDFWNVWNADSREHGVARVSSEQAAVILRWLDALGRRPLDIIDVGCGTGWLSGQVRPFGSVTATDLADDVVERAQVRYPDVRFLAGDFMALDLGAEAYDVVVTLEVLSHVADQRQFVDKLADILRPGGHLMLATQNRPALLRNSIPDPAPGQLRHWVDRHELRSLLEARFEVQELFSITPTFNRGILRLVNSQKLEGYADTARLGSLVRAVRRKEEARFMGWTLMALAQKRV
jgi:2-polyprenyl-3-methyl-5-hydroxy-6-metoxy-1,4-benzoquinol methylase